MMFVSLGIGTVAALVLIVVVSILTGGSVNVNTQTTSALVGKSVGGFTLSGLSGGHVKAPWKNGHAAVLIFFASWCEPCKAEMPKVARYLRSHVASPVVVVGVDANDASSAAANFVKGAGVGFPIAFDPGGTVTTGVFGFATVPETVFVSAKGIVTRVYYGAIPPAQLASGITALRST